MQHVKATAKWMAFRAGDADESCDWAGVVFCVYRVLALGVGAGWAAADCVTSKFDVATAG
jgi:hypothetical protein